MEECYKLEWSIYVQSNPRILVNLPVRLVILVNLLVILAIFTSKTRKNPRSKGAMGPGLGSFLAGTDPLWRNYWWTIGGTMRLFVRRD